MVAMYVGGKRAYVKCLILWATAIVLVGVLPLRNYVGHSHWEYIKWLPTAEDLQSPKYLFDIGTDLIANTLLFLPIGFLLSRLLLPSGLLRQLLVAGAVGGTMSLGIELYQVYCHNRFPSIFDVLTNLGGSLLGVRVAVARPDFLQVAGCPKLTPIPPDRTPVP